MIFLFKFPTNQHFSLGEKPVPKEPLGLIGFFYCLVVYSCRETLAVGEEFRLFWFGVVLVLFLGFFWFCLVLFYLWMYAVPFLKPFLI